jgi:hypothetical protein
MNETMNAPSVNSHTHSFLFFKKNINSLTDDTEPQPPTRVVGNNKI